VCLYCIEYISWVGKAVPIMWGILQMFLTSSRIIYAGGLEEIVDVSCAMMWAL
jgi:hypothetical protein